MMFLLVSDQRAKNERVTTKEEDIHHYSTLNHAGQGCEAKVINHTSYTEAASSSQSHCSSSLEGRRAKTGEKMQ